MRIAGKRLRYAIELFAEGWDPKILNFAKRAARLQSTLGLLHDCDINAGFGIEIVKAKKAKRQRKGRRLHLDAVSLHTHQNPSTAKVLHTLETLGFKRYRQSTERIFD